MRLLPAYLASCALAAIVPLAPKPGEARIDDVGFPDWPSQFEGQRLRQVRLSVQEQKFAGGFPGRIAAFTDGRRQIVMRWITQPTRKAHPAIDCYRGLGYTIRTMPLWVDAHDRVWSSFEATKLGTLRVREQIHDAHGNAWTDVSAWYWAAVLGRTKGPWWAMTVAEPFDRATSTR